MFSSHQVKGFTLLSLVCFIFLSCGKEVEDPYPPSKPEWIPKSGVEAWPEQGIDAAPGNVIYLEWYPNPETDIDGYALYRRAASDTLERFDQIAYLSINDPFQPSTSYSDDDVIAAANVERYYYYLRAKDTGGNLSETSDTLDYALLIPIYAATMSPQSLSDTVETPVQCSWSYNYHAAMEDYVLTILDVNTQDLIARTWFQPTQYVGGTESWTFHPYWRIAGGDSTWIDLQSGHSYQWRIDMQAGYGGDDTEDAGSESAWRYLTVR